MENSKDINNRLDELFNKARTTKPVMEIEEVRSLIAAAPVSVSSSVAKSPKNTSRLLLLLVGFVLIVGIGGGWFYFSNDKNDEIASTPVVNSNATNNSNDAKNNNDQTELNNTTTEPENTDITKEESKLPATNNENKQEETVAEKTKEPAATTPKVAEPSNKDLSKNNTYIETAGEMNLVFHSLDDKEVKLKVKDNAVKEMLVNGKAIPASDYGKYKDIVDAGLKIAAEDKAKNPVTASSKTPDEQKRDNVNTLLFTAFTDQLKQDKLINEEKYSFKLTPTEMLIDGKQQPDAMRQKYLDLFKTTAGKDLSGTFKFDHGMK